MINMCIMTIRVLCFFYIYKGFQKSLYQCTRAHFLCDTSPVISNREWPLLRVSEWEKNLLTGFYSCEESNVEKNIHRMNLWIFSWKDFMSDLSGNWLQIQESNLLSLGYEPSEMTFSLICYMMHPSYLHVGTSTGASNYLI